MRDTIRWSAGAAAWHSPLADRDCRQPEMRPSPSPMTMNDRAAFTW
jgi:hypothetical protein